ncbi:MAG: hypothetical protein JWM17_2646 [Actinobacteria bacterium]|nr:hypothetical protein [Actinomycetota bacterium]
MEEALRSHGHPDPPGGRRGPTPICWSRAVAASINSRRCEPASAMTARSPASTALLRRWCGYPPRPGICATLPRWRAGHLGRPSTPQSWASWSPSATTGALSASGRRHRSHPGTGAGSGWGRDCGPAPPNRPPPTGRRDRPWRRHTSKGPEDRPDAGSERTIRAPLPACATTRRYQAPICGSRQSRGSPLPGHAEPCTSPSRRSPGCCGRACRRRWRGPVRARP